MRVLITGGLGGIGFAAFARLARDGHRVCIVDRMPPPADFSADYVEADLAVAGATGAAFARAMERVGGFDAVVNSMGIYECAGFDEFTWEAYERNMAVNVRAPLEMILAWLATVPPQTPGRIVNIVSAAARIGSRDLAYSSSKAALLGATRSLARSLAPRGISVFAVSPGLIDTPMSRAMPAERRAGHARAALAQRAGRPEEVADLIHFLLTGQAEYMSGANLSIDSGLTW